MLGKFIINYRDNKIVGLLGIEPRLFWTKTRRVASYTIGQLAANLNYFFL
jgi:hypothetical protein